MIFGSIVKREAPENTIIKPTADDVTEISICSELPYMKAHQGHIEPQHETYPIGSVVEAICNEGLTPMHGTATCGEDGKFSPRVFRCLTGQLLLQFGFYVLLFNIIITNYCFD